MMRQIQLDLFRERTGITYKMRGSKVVSLREITQVRGIEVMSKSYLRNLLAGVVLEGDPQKQVYEGCQIDFITYDPRSLRLGQTFVERSKCNGILECLSNIFSDYCVAPGFVRSIPSIIYGETKDSDSVFAHYLPPIVEEHKGRPILIDGVHRHFLAKAAGCSIDSIVVRNPNIPFPCAVHDWSNVRIVDQKPLRSERFAELRRDLFRVFTHVGIDG
jgi:hypothetical protein